MEQAPRRPDEEQRLRSVRALDALLGQEQPALDQVTATASRLFGAEVALVTLIGEERQHNLSRVGLAAAELARRDSICDHVVAADATLLVPDLQTDERFRRDALLREHSLRAYAGAPLHSPDGQPVGSLCVMWRTPRELDPQERSVLAALAGWAEAELRASETLRHAEALREAEHQLREALDGAPAGVLVVDGAGRLQWASRPAERLFDLPSPLPELDLKHLLPTFPRDELGRAARRASDERGVQTGRRSVQPGERTDGVRFPAEVTSSQLHDGSGRSVIFVRDLHDERSERVRLALLRERAEVVFDAVEEGVLAVDRDGSVAFGNLALARMVQRRRLDMPGTPWHELLHGTCTDGRCELSDVLSLVGRRVGPLHLVRGDGTRLPVELAARLVRADDAGEAGVVLTVQDLTERLRVDRLKDEFLSAVSHELRTPLTSIRGSLGLLSSGAVPADSAQGRRMLEIASQSTERLSRLVNDILDLERLRAGKVDLHPARHRVETLLSSAAHAVSGAATAAGVVLDVEAPPLSVVADADRVVQILTNLLGNAVKFSPASSRVQLSAEPGDGVVRFLVRDRGRGIPPQDLERIFDRFAQVDKGDARRDSGTGLGLAIARGLAQQHGGRLSATSEVGVGSTFVLELPAAPDHARRLLYAPCDEVPETLRQVLARLGYEVVSARSLELDGPDRRPAGVLLADCASTDERDLVRSAAAAAGLPLLALSRLPAGDRLEPLDAVAGRPSGRVLLVEDDTDLAEVLTATLEDAGLQVTVVARPDDAVREVLQSEPDLVVLDMVLEGGDGFEVAAELRHRGLQPRPAVLVYTALDLDEAQRARLQTGSTRFLRKGEALVADVAAQVVRLLAVAPAAPSSTSQPDQPKGTA